MRLKMLWWTYMAVHIILQVIFVEFDLNVNKILLLREIINHSNDVSTILGVDPTKSQWKEIADIIEERKLIPFFDCAYQGMKSKAI